MNKLLKICLVLIITAFSTSMFADEIVTIPDGQTVDVVISPKNHHVFMADLGFKVNGQVADDYMHNNYVMICNDGDNQVFWGLANDSKTEMNPGYMAFKNQVECTIDRLQTPKQYNGPYTEEYHVTLNLNRPELRDAVDAQLTDFFTKRFPKFAPLMDYKIAIQNQEVYPYKLIDLVRYTSLFSQNYSNVFAPPVFVQQGKYFTVMIDQGFFMMKVFFEVDHEHKTLIMRYLAKNGGNMAEIDTAFDFNQLMNVYSKWPEYIMIPYVKDK